MNKKAILIVVAVMILVSLAFAGMKLIENKKYNEQISAAEKAMTDGDYERAEDEYVSAVKINKRKPTAHEGLAYVQLIQGNYKEAEKEYEALYTSTKDEKYHSAAIDASEGRLPTSADLSVKTAWRKIKLSEAPYSAALEEVVKQSSWEPFYDYRYDSKEVPDGIVLEQMMAKVANYGGVLLTPADEINEDTFNDYGWEIYDDSDYECSRPWKPDPKGLSKNSMVPYCVCDQEELEKDLRNIFDLSDASVAALHKEAENSEWFYIHDGNYYRLMLQIPFREIKIRSVQTDGTKYCVQYSSQSAGGDTVQNYFEMLELKNIEGKTYWTISYNGLDAPEETYKATDSNRFANVWETISVEELPERTQLYDLLQSFWNFPLDTDHSYDCKGKETYQGIDNMYYFIDQMNYPGSETIGYTSEDARGWGSSDPLFEGCSYISKEAQDWAMKNILNCTDDQIDRMLKKAEQEKRMYLEDGYYYSYYYITGIGAYYPEIVDAKTDGENYLLQFDIGAPYYEDGEQVMGRIDRSMETSSRMYTVVKLKEIDGEKYWSIYYYGEKAPDITKY